MNHFTVPEFDFKSLINRFNQLHILVVGDLMLDRYIWGDVNRISPEAPVPVVNVNEKENRVGGAGNVANNLTSLECKVTTAGICGEDSEGNIIIDILRGNSHPPIIQKVKNRSTTIKTRIIARHQQVVRVDEECAIPLPSDIHSQLLKQIETSKDLFDGVIVSDYDKGLITPVFMQKLLKIFKNKLVIIDPKGYDYSKYKFVNAIKPNWNEFKTAIQKPELILDDIRPHAEKLVKKLKMDGIVVTLGENGVYILDADGVSYTLPTKSIDVFDVSGAGDTFIATFTAGLLLSNNWLQAASAANIASGIVVSKVGTATISKDEILQTL